MSGWDQHHDIEALEELLRAREGRETLDAEIVLEVGRIRRMFDHAKAVVANWRPPPTPDEWDE
jgi:hypothetical protein